MDDIVYPIKTILSLFCVKYNYRNYIVQNNLGKAVPKRLPLNPFTKIVILSTTEWWGVRQYGKTTTINLLMDRLAGQYAVLSISFEGMEDEIYASADKARNQRTEVRKIQLGDKLLIEAVV